MQTLINMHEKFLERTDPGELLPVLAYEEDTNVFLMDDGYVGTLIECHPMNGVDETTDKMLGALFAINYPDDAFLQVMLWASPDIKMQLDNYRASCRLDVDTPAAPFLKKSINAKTEFFRNATAQSLSDTQTIRVRDFRVLVTCKIPFKGEMPTKKDMQEMVDIGHEMIECLRSMGLRPAYADAIRYLHIMRTMVNWSDDALWKNADHHPYNDDVPLRSQIFDLDNRVSRDEHSVYLKDKVVKTFSVRRWPKYFHLAQMQRLIGDLKRGARGIRDNFLYTTSIYFPPREKITQKLEAKKQTVNFTAFGKLLKWVPRLALQKDGYDALFSEIDEGARPVKAYTQFVLFSDDAVSAKKSAANLKTFFRESTLEVMEDPYMTLPIFLNGLPFGPEKAHIDKLKRYLTFTDKHVTHFLPMIADWRGCDSMVVPLVSRNGQLVGIDLYETTGNYNGIIAAASGSGKSVLGNEIVNNYLARGAQVWTFDIGRSFEKACKANHGELMVFDPSSNVSVNPFPLIDDYSEHADALVNQVCAMASISGNLSEFQISRLTEIMDQCWQSYGQEMTITLIAERCKQDDDDRIKDVGHQLYAFTLDGEFGRYVHGNNTINFTNQFTVLELEELSGRPHLQQIILLQLITQVQTQMYLGDRSVKKLCILDESWDLLTKGNTARFMETGYRRFRKYGGSAISILQSINDLYETSSGRAIAENSQYYFLLGQKAATIQMLKDMGRFPTSDWGYELMASAHTAPGQYSEIFCSTPYGEGIGRLYLDRFHQLLSTTKPDEVHMLNQLQAGGLSIEDAIMAYIDKVDSQNKKVVVNG